MNAYMIIYIEKFAPVQCVVAADNQEQALEKASDRGIRDIVSITDLNSYFLN